MTGLRLQDAPRFRHAPARGRRRLALAPGGSILRGSREYVHAATCGGGIVGDIGERMSLIYTSAWACWAMITLASLLIHVLGR